jgi:acetyltransferase-like isoleucine patch superfamily enzyme
MRLSKILPEKLLVNIINLRVKLKYDVIFEKGATAGMKTIFEGKNLLKSNAFINKCYVGLGTYISGDTKLVKAKIGRFCSIGQNVTNGFGIHPTNFISTHPCFYSLQKQAGFTFVNSQMYDEHKYVDNQKKYHIEIGNDVWVGNNVQIMDGVTIGDGAIIGTGAVVTKDVSSYSIVGGVPAKFIRFRFAKKEIDLLIKTKWWMKDVSWISANAESFMSFSEFNKCLNR